MLKFLLGLFFLLFLGSSVKTPDKRNPTKRPNLNGSDTIIPGSKPNLDSNSNDEIENVVVKILLVCDKAFGDIFNHSRNQILDYFTVYFWDINNRFRTLTSTNISFIISDLVVINSTKNQPFIETTRDPNSGRANLDQILQKFSKWVYTKFKMRSQFQSRSFDVAIAITNTRLTSRGGVSFVGGACGVSNSSKRYYGSIVWSDQGDWGSVATGAHELGHILGARHDTDTEHCKNEPIGYIMGGAIGKLQWYFSNCSDKAISKFIHSKQANSLQKLQGTKISNKDKPCGMSFTNALAPTMQVQCRRRLRNPKAFIESKETGNCEVMKCLEPVKGGWLIWKLPPVDNSPCFGGGRCFRGVCIKSPVEAVSSSQ